LLAYEVKLPSGAYPNMTLIVDASTGKVLKTDDGIRYDGPAHGTGIGLHGEVRNVETFIWNNKNYLLDATLPMYLSPISGLKGVISTYDALNDTTEDGYLKIELVSDPNGDGNFNDNERLRAAVDAQVFSKMVYEFYSTHFGRNSFDNNGNTIKNVLHYKMNYNNAFWNGEFMSYGDGDGVLFSNLAGGLDVIAHEITHGVTERTAGLVYELQPGAINESISDVFASLLDSTNWQIGEDIYTPATPGDALRNMQDPHNGGIADDLSSGWQPAHMSEYRVMENNEKHDHGGVHMNSGIPNKAFYNVASVIGHWKAGRIWYRSLTTYLTKNAQFTDLREACLNSANDLYGKESEEYKTVVNAFDAVGVNPSEPGNITELLYDDGDASTGLYEKDANFQLAVKFTPPTSDSEIQSIRILLHGDANKNGNGHFSLVMYDDNGTGGLPGSKLINPYSYTPAGVGWQSFTISGVTVKNNFYVGMLYDGTNQPLVGADNPPGNERTYEYNPASGTWYNLTGSDNYTVFIRATIKSTTTDVEIDPKVPDKFALMQNYPNPFNPSTTIKYSLPASTDVEIIVYDAAGRQVAELVNNAQNPGTYTVTWNGKNDKGAPVSSGIYFYRFKAGSFVQTNKMILLK
ncbi:MAG: M4 family metallopeptidase, partial [Ignavibacteriales bacterium]